MSANLKAKKIRRVSCTNANLEVQGWWYENDKSIHVYLRDDTGKVTISGRIPRSQIVAWLKRAPSRRGRFE